MAGDDMRVGILVVMDEQGVASTTRLTTQGLDEVEQAAERMGREARGVAAGAGSIPACAGEPTTGSASVQQQVD